MLQERLATREVLAKAVAEYQRYQQIAEVRVRVGSANPIEALTLRNPVTTYQLRLNQADAETQALRQELAILTGSAGLPMPGDSFDLHVLPQGEGEQLATRLAAQERSAAAARQEVIAAELKPSLSAGYMAQKFFQTDWLNAFQVGLEVPLFRAQVRQRIEAQAIELDAAAAHLQAQQQLLQRRRIALTTEIANARQAAEMYRLQLAELNPELQRVTALNYEAGQIGYLDILNAVGLLLQNQLALNEAILTHNLAVARYRLSFNL
jgi:cobalt-zinc-cadmium resistance protein CzcA